MFSEFPFALMMKADTLQMEILFFEGFKFHADWSDSNLLMKTCNGPSPVLCYYDVSCIAHCCIAIFIFLDF